MNYDQSCFLRSSSSFWASNLGSSASTSISTSFQQHSKVTLNTRLMSFQIRGRIINIKIRGDMYAVRRSRLKPKGS